jgi:hypothetical protein
MKKKGKKIIGNAAKYAVNYLKMTNLFPDFGKKERKKDGKRIG